MRWLVAPALIAAALLVACGDGNEDEIRTAIEEFVTDLGDNPPRAYTAFAQECKDQLPFAAFATQLVAFEGILGDAEIEVQEFEIIDEGDDEVVVEYNVVLVSDGEDIPFSSSEDEGPSTFVREDGRWRLADCDTFGQNTDETIAVPAPPDTDAARELALAAEANDDATLPGEFVDLAALYGGSYPDTASHTTGDVPYENDQGLPPAGGPHWSGDCGNDPSAASAFCGPAPWGIYLVGWEAETLVHNMEHGGVIVWYRTDDPGMIDELEAIVAERLLNGELLVLTPYAEMDAGQVALTSWSRREIIPEADFDAQRVEAFIDAHERRFNPETF